MASRRFLNDNVEIHNYIGEIDDEAKYQITYLQRCCCVLNTGADKSQSDVSSDNAKLYIFDKKTVATDENGNARIYIPYSEYILLADKTPYWTISDEGTDHIVVCGYDKPLQIKSFNHKTRGNKRMWHFEVDAQ